VLRGRTVFLVDHKRPPGGALGTPKNFVPGADCQRQWPLWARVKALPQELRNTETMGFTQRDKKHATEMIGNVQHFS